MNGALVLLLVWSAFATWIIFLGGAELLHGTRGGRVLIHWFANGWSSKGIKLYIGAIWIGAIVLYLVWRFSA